MTKSRGGCRVLTVKQPWAMFLIADEIVIAGFARVDPELAAMLPKNVENRSWGTPYRGRILIHAATAPDTDALQRFSLSKTGFVYGAVLGAVQLDDIITDSQSPWAIAGRRHWQVSNPVRLHYPVKHRGGQGLLTASRELIDDVHRAGLDVR